MLISIIAFLASVMLVEADEFEYPPPPRVDFDSPYHIYRDPGFRLKKEIEELIQGDEYGISGISGLRYFETEVAVYLAIGIHLFKFGGGGMQTNILVRSPFREGKWVVLEVYWGVNMIHGHIKESEDTVLSRIEGARMTSNRDKNDDRFDSE